MKKNKKVVKAWAVVIRKNNHIPLQPELRGNELLYEILETRASAYRAKKKDILMKIV